MTGVFEIIENNKERCIIMKLESGKTYYDNNGNEVTVVFDKEGGQFPFLGSNGEFYTENGGYFNYTTSDFDLVEEKQDNTQG